jgi:hypothetical protein
LGTGAQWRELPEKYPPFQTRHRRFQQWMRAGKLEEALRLLARLLYEQGKLNLEEAFVDATFASAKKGLRGRPYPPGQGYEDRRCRRWQQSCSGVPGKLVCWGGSRHICLKRFACLVQPC